MNIHLYQEVTLPVPEEIRQVVLTELRRRAPLLDTVKMKEHVLAWLGKFRFPGRSDKSSWNDYIKEFPSRPEEKELSSGRRLRLAINLFTTAHHYLISIVECLAPDVRGTYIITVHVNWTRHELQVQQVIDESYKGAFDNGLKARHVIWIQSFADNELFAALDACAMAIFGHELTPAIDPVESHGIPVKIPIGSNLNIPESAD